MRLEGEFVMRYSKMATSTATIAAIISIYLTTTGTATAGIFDDPKNLEVLPEDISAEDLRQTMRGFAQGTGSRCSACHVGKIEADLSTYDFSIDDKEKKLKARKIIQLVRDINENILVAAGSALGGRTIIDRQDHAGHPIGLVAGEVKTGIGDVLGLADSPERLVRRRFKDRPCRRRL